MSKIWTRNYDNYIAAIFGGCADANSVRVNVPSYEKPLYKNPDGLYATFSTRNTTNQNSAFTCKILNLYMSGQTRYGLDSSFDGPFLCLFGGGNQEVTKDDYNLQTPYQSGFSIGSSSTINPVWNEETHSYTIGCKLLFNYTAAEELAVSEFGLFGHMFGGYPLPSNAFALFYREVFVAPITLLQNDSIEVTITQTIVQPNYTPYPTTA